MALVMAGGDNHIPFQNRQVTDKFLKTIRDGKPDVVMLMGDVIDLYNVSRYTKERKSFLASDEILATERFLAEIQKQVSKKTRIVYLEGNHETRLKKYLIRNAPDLQHLPSLEIPAILNLEEYGIEWRPHNPRRGPRIDGVLYTHYIYDRRSSGVSGKLALDIATRIGESVCIGHVHRLGAVYHTMGRKILMAVEAGGLCSVKAGQDYTDFPNWNPGFVIITEGHPTLVNL